MTLRAIVLNRYLSIVEILQYCDMYYVFGCMMTSILITRDTDVEVIETIIIYNLL